MKTQIQTQHEVVVAAIAEVEILIAAEENSVGLDPVAAVAAMKNGAVIDSGPGAKQSYGNDRRKFHIRITAEVAGRRVKIGDDYRITARVGAVLPGHNNSGLIRDTSLLTTVTSPLQMHFAKSSMPLPITCVATGDTFACQREVTVWSFRGRSPPWSFASKAGCMCSGTATSNL